MRRNHYIAIFALLFVLWIFIINQLFLHKPRTNTNLEDSEMRFNIEKLERALETEQKRSDMLIESVKYFLKNPELIEKHAPVKSRASSETKTVPINLHHPESVKNISMFHEGSLLNHSKSAVAILVFACNRVTVSRCLDKLIKYRPSKSDFPIIVSQDCNHSSTTDIIKSYGDDVYLIQQPDQRDIFVPPKEKKFKGYFKIARHYGWALNETFITYNFNAAVVVEDDLDISSDFYEYFTATLPILRSDSTLWCVSAWNDNGKQGLIDLNAADLLYRTDFFPGLGWMLIKPLWLELMNKWPKSYWDDWIRDPRQRKDRACIRPELSRTRTFGKIGVSNGLFFEKHLKFIYLNEKHVQFTKKNLTFLLKDNYDRNFLKIVYNSPIVSYEELLGGLNNNVPVRIIYSSKDTFKKLSKLLGLMDDLKSGVPRTAYLGIVSFTYKNRRVFLTPGNHWKGYDVSW